jgi:hypothetical protein
VATKIYVTSNAINSTTGVGVTFNVPAAVVTAAFNSGWEGTMAGGTVGHYEGWANVTGMGSRPNSANVNLQVKNGSNTTTQERYGIRVYFGPLTAGQTFTGGQAIEAGIMGAHGATFGFHWLTAAIRILKQDGSVGKESQSIATSTSGIYANTNSYPATTYESRWDSGTSAATNYTTVAGDWLVCEYGVHYETASSLILNFKVGDGNASDITSVDSTTVRNPYFQVNDSLTVTPDGGVRGLMMLGCGI